MEKKLKKKKDRIFQTVESLQLVVNVINESAIAISDVTRTIRESNIPDVLLGALGASTGAAISFTLLYGLGTVGLSGAGIMSGLATAGGGLSVLVGGAVSASVAGIFVLALPIAGLAAGGVMVSANLRNKQLYQELFRLQKETLKMQINIENALKLEVNANEERIEYLTSLNILLKQAIKDLNKDLSEES